MFRRVLKPQSCIVLLLIGLLFWGLACEQNKMPLPVPQSDSDTFGANDTSYIELNPVWDANTLGLTLSQPADITIGPDGVLYVADEGNDRIVALSQAGERLMRDGLDDISNISHPRGLDIDSRLTLLIANGTGNIYGWNQYFNTVEIDSVAEQLLIFDTETSQTETVTFEEYINRIVQGESPDRYVVQKLLFERDLALVDSVRSPYVLYRANEQDASFTDVAAGPYGSDLCYLTEKTYHRITELALLPWRAVKIAEGGILFQYVGIKAREIATFGSGAGTVNHPTGITTDRQGNLYFSQAEGNFKVQKLSSGSFDPAYVLYQHDIMDLQRFERPENLALDDNGDIFVIDTGARHVLKFGNSGSNAGQLISLGNKGLATATFEDARGILAHNDIVYVVEGGQNRIRRFQYSVSEEDLPDDYNRP